MPTHLVWFKRDLRIYDHEPLYRAARRAGLICLYIIEPSQWTLGDYTARHSVFLFEALTSLKDALAQLGGCLTVRCGEPVVVFETLLQEQPFSAIWAHEETGNYLSYQRDRQVRAWAKRRGMPFCECPSGGVMRRLGSPKIWMGEWFARMNTPIQERPPDIKGVPLQSDTWPTSIFDNAPAPGRFIMATAGVAEQRLTEFLTVHSNQYLTSLSSPVTAFEHSSLLSPYLTFGLLSSKMVFQASQRQVREVKESKSGLQARLWLKSLRAFQSRLRWRDHFIQRLEHEPGLEFYNFHRGFDGLREGAVSREFLHAWREGVTGFPMIDACVRALRATGWLNFRMRALLVSFASYYLWLHWRETGRFLATQWLDSEPGIHWSQMQMQSGVTGIHTLRIYSPAKQVIDHDPQGIFIRHWVPELAAVPDAYLAEPWQLPPLTQQMLGCVIGKTYPKPIVDAKVALKITKARLAPYHSKAQIAKAVLQTKPS